MITFVHCWAPCRVGNHSDSLLFPKVSPAWKVVNNACLEKNRVKVIRKVATSLSAIVTWHLCVSRPHRPLVVARRIESSIRGQNMIPDTYSAGL